MILVSNWKGLFPTTGLCTQILCAKKILFSNFNMHHKAVYIMSQNRHTVSENILFMKWYRSMAHITLACTTV